jgi:hypothetical protein
MLFATIDETENNIEIIQKDYKLLVCIIIAAIIYYFLLYFINPQSDGSIVLALIPIALYFFIFPKRLFVTRLQYQKAKLQGKLVEKTGNWWTGDLRIKFQK